MTVGKTALVVALAVGVGTAWGQLPRGAPHLGYLYPAGGQQGTTFRIAAGGQTLQGANAVYVSGAGVHASVVEYVPALNGVQLGDVAKHLRALIKQRRAEAAGGRAGAAPAPAAGNEQLPPLPDHPLLRGLDQKSLPELLAVLAQLFDRKRQRNDQIAETVIIQVTVDPDAPPGDREVRLGTAAGLTNPMVFQVGSLPETAEVESYGPAAFAPRQGPPLTLPVVLNGQITPGDVDRFRFRAQQGQQVVIEVQARHLIPYLADAVPGWFQATVALFDAKGDQVAFADDYRGDPDPVLCYPVPATGEYQLEVRDALYRGREDFVYRIKVGALPFITEVFPLGGAAGVATAAAIGGWNLPAPQLPLDTAPGGPRVRQASLVGDGAGSNEVAYAVDELPEFTETEPNDTPAQAQTATLPLIVNGRIAQPGDGDVFAFRGRAGDAVVAEVVARRLQSPLDSLLRLTDAAGTVLAWNDDHADAGSGLCTNPGDSYLSTQLPQDGVYYVGLSDAEGHGGEAYGYRLRISAPRPDLELRVSPSSVNVPPGRAAAVTVHVLRRDGFDGEINVELADAPAGFTLQGGRIPPGLDRIRMTLGGPQAWVKQPFALQLVGQTQLDGQPATRPVVPCEDMMQAFAYHHLVPSQELLVQMTGGRRPVQAVKLADAGPVRIPSGGTAQVRVTAPGGPLLQQVKLELSEPPAGVTLQEVTAPPDGLILVLKADADRPPVGYADNLIVEASTEITRKPPGGAAARTIRVPLGALPAIAFEVVPPA